MKAKRYPKSPDVEKLLDMICEHLATLPPAERKRRIAAGARIAREAKERARATRRKGPVK